MENNYTDDKNFTEAEKAFEDYMKLSAHDNLSLKEAFISGWNRHRQVSKKLYTLEEVKEIVN
jgi:hypothetical protein